MLSFETKKFDYFSFFLFRLEAIQILEFEEGFNIYAIFAKCRGHLKNGNFSYFCFLYSLDLHQPQILLVKVVYILPMIKS